MVDGRQGVTRVDSDRTDRAIEPVDPSAPDRDEPEGAGRADPRRRFGFRWKGRRSLGFRYTGRRSLGRKMR